MRIILLGATGYLGSNIAAALINSGHELTAIIRGQVQTLQNSINARN
ncbi:MAG: NAD(P)-dependent oxidoreductase [Synergistaceae bacterium]|nr:NAD(P)-dependent oxidoreductase [Synergistaceae bacterium]